MQVSRFHWSRAVSPPRGFACLIGCALLLPLQPVLAQSAESSAQAEDRQHDYAIAGQSLAAALGEFGRQSDIQVSFDAELAQDQQAPAVRGRYSESQALQLLLRDSGLGWTLTPERTLLLYRLPQNGALTLAPAHVSTSGVVAEVADGPVQGYRATRSATGTKTDTALRDIPQSIQVIPRQVLDDQQINQLSDALSNVSSVQRGNTHGGSTESFVVRGFHSRTYAVDGMLMNPLVSRPEVVSDLVNVERVEVLKGPASVLYGQGDPGGLINLVTRKPSFTPEAQVKAQAGSNDFYRLEANASGPLDPAKTLAGRIAVAGQTDAGFRDTFRDNRHTYVSPSLRWEPSELTTVDVGLEYTDLTSQFDRGVLPQNGGISMNPKRFLHEPWSHDDADKLAAWFRVEHQVNDWLTLRQSTRWDDSHKQRYVVDLRGLREDGRSLQRRATDGDEKIRTLDMQFEAIATFATGGLRHTALVGVEYLKGDRKVVSYRGDLADIDIYEPVYGALPTNFRFNEIADYELETQSLYLQDQIDLSEQWKLLLGARYDSTKQDNLSTNANYVETPTKLDPEKISPRVGLVYQPTDWLSLYASYSTSFVPQGDIDRNRRPLDPEEGKQYEVGAKFDLIPDRLSATLSVFELTRENVASEDPIDDSFSIQTGEQRVRGVELDISGQPLDGWQIIANASVLNAELTKHTPTEDSPLAEGNKLEGVPTLSGSLWSSYQLQSGRFKGLGFGAGVIAVGSREGDLGNIYDVSGYTRIDASVFYDINDKLRVALNGRNLTDREYLETVAGTDGNYYGEPASVLASVSAKF
jgi:iron complex outermembrane receptor protein